MVRVERRSLFRPSFNNDPAFRGEELKEYPDSFVILSYEHIEVFFPEACKEFADMFAHETGGRTSWQIVRDYMRDYMQDA